MHLQGQKYLNYPEIYDSKGHANCDSLQHYEN